MNSTITYDRLIHQRWYWYYLISKRILSATALQNQNKKKCSYRSSSYMRKYCPVSCRDAPVPLNRMDCKDAHPKCVEWARIGECQSNNDMKKFCPLSCGTCTNNNKPKEMTAGSTTNTKNFDDSCVDTHQSCPGWAVRTIFDPIWFLWVLRRWSNDLFHYGVLPCLVYLWYILSFVWTH